MDSKLILIKIITLLYCQSICERVRTRSSHLAIDIIDKLKLPETVTETDSGRNIIIALRETALWLAGHDDEAKFDFPSLLQRIRLNAMDDYTVFQAFADVEKYHELEQDELALVCESLQKELRYFLGQVGIRDAIHKAHRELFYPKKPVDLRKYVESLISDLEVYHDGWNGTTKKFVLNLMDMSNPESLAEVLERAKDDMQGKGGFRSGWQCVNEMLGESQTFRRGMFVLIGALTHNYKSGFCHDLYRHFCLYNDPVLDDPTRKPLILYFSSENRAEEDLVRMYVALKENETGQAVDVTMTPSSEMASYVARRLTERGYHTAMLRLDPSEFKASDLFEIVLEYEAKGYEVQAIVFDYLALINKAGIGVGAGMTGEDTRMLMQKVRTFMSARNILFITPHQLSQEAMGKKREGIGDFVGEIAGKNYWDGSKRIANEADLEIFLDIVERNRKHYLAGHRGKHRTVKATPVAKRRWYLPFEEIGYIPEDVNGPKRSLESLTAAEAGASIDFE